MRAKHRRTLKAIFAHPVAANLRWGDIESLLRAAGADIEQREGSRIAVIWHGEVNIFHRPHPAPTAGKAALRALRRILERHGVTP